jgi:hypothetical protein
MDALARKIIRFLQPQTAPVKPHVARRLQEIREQALRQHLDDPLRQDPSTNASGLVVARR